MYQTDKDLVIEAMIAGVKPEDIQVNITRDIVTLSGKREANKSVVHDDYFYQELYWGTFSRSIMLPHEIDIESAEAIEKHGMLIIKMPKIDKGRQSKLKVKSL
jgi:HSP20 family protein